MVNVSTIPKESPLGCMLDKWSDYSYEPMSKRKMIFYFNSVWPQYLLGSKEWWPLNGSLNYNTILKLELFCEEAGKNDKIPYMQAFVLLHQDEKKSDSCRLTV